MLRLSRTLLMLFLLAGVCLPAAAESEPPRIVSAGGSVTEIIYALDRGDWVVATDNTSMFPPPARDVTKLGYFRQLSTEGILAQQPTHLIGADATGPDVMLNQVKNAGVQVAVLHQPRSLSGLFGVINEIGNIVDAKAPADKLIANIRQDVETQKQHYLNSVGNSPQLNGLFVVAHNDRGLTVAGRDTVPQALFLELGINNVAQALKGYKLIDNETVLASNPDFILVAGHTLHGEQALHALCTQKAIAATFAGQHCLVKPIDSSIGLGLSPRFAEALAIVSAQAKAALEQKQSQTEAAGAGAL